MRRASVIIVSHGRRDLLDRCLASVRRHVDLSRDEVIVVDSGSDRSVTTGLVEEWPEAEFVLLEENVGFARASNLGAMRSSGEHLLFLNSDAELVEDVVTPLVDWLRASSTRGIVGPRLCWPDGRHQPSTHGFPSIAKEALRLFPGVKRRVQDASLVRRLAGWAQRRRPGNLLARYATPDSPLRVEEVTGACFLVTRRLFGDLGGFDPGYFMYIEEADLCFRASRRGYEIHYFPEVRVVHGLGGSSRGGDRRLVERIQAERWRSLLRFFRKNRGPAGTLALRSVLGTLLGLRLLVAGVMATCVPAAREVLRRESGWLRIVLGESPGRHQGRARPDERVAPVDEPAGDGSGALEPVLSEGSPRSAG